MSDRCAAWRLALIAIALAGALAACKKASADYCTDDTACREVDTHCDVVNMICISDFTPDAEPIPCDQTHPCPDTLPFCDESNGPGVCAICGEGGPNACPPSQPVCVDNGCAGCTSDVQCVDSEVCMDDGTCADEGDVLYVAPTGGGDTCGKDTPCTLATAVGRLSAARNIVHLSPELHMITSELNPLFSSTFIGRDATIQLNATNQEVFDLSGAQRTITFLYVDITGGDGSNDLEGNGIQCASGITVNARHLEVGPNDGVGIRSTGCKINLVDVELINNDDGLNAVGGDTVISQSIVRNNTVIGINYSNGTLVLRRSVVLSNLGGGVSLNGGTHTLENNLLVGNGAPAAGVGGVAFNLAGTYTLRFNTIAGNDVSGTGLDAIQCNGVGLVLDLSSNIIAEEAHDPGCAHESSLFPEDVVPPSGTGNIVGDPMFITEAIANPLVDGFYRIQALSAARNAGESIAEVAEDIDGEARPESGTTPDIGADEVH
jgi:hypothetical protein